MIAQLVCRRCIPSRPGFYLAAAAPTAMVHRGGPALALPGTPLGDHPQAVLPAPVGSCRSARTATDFPGADRRHLPRPDGPAAPGLANVTVTTASRRARCASRRWTPTSPIGWWRSDRHRHSCAARTRDYDRPATRLAPPRSRMLLVHLVHEEAAPAPGTHRVRAGVGTGNPVWPRGARRDGRGLACCVGHTTYRTGRRNVSLRTGERQLARGEAAHEKRTKTRCA